jgi:hypothetical protein
VEAESVPAAAHKLGRAGTADEKSTSVKAAADGHALLVRLDIDLPERAASPRSSSLMGVKAGTGKSNSQPPQPSARVGDVKVKS